MIDPLKTIAYLSDELRKMNEAVVGQYAALQRLTNEREELKKISKEQGDQIESLLQEPASNTNEMATLREEVSRQKAVIAGYVEEVGLDDKRIAELERVLKTIPGCKEHGDLCIPHALDWIARAVHWEPLDFPDECDQPAADAASTEGEATK